MKTSGEADPFLGEAGVSIAISAVEDMAARRLSTCPANYELWAIYKAGTNAALTREMDRLIAAGDLLTDQQNRALAEKFFGGTRLSVQLIEAGESAARELAKASATIRKAGIDTAAYSDELNDAVRRVQSGLSAGDFEALLLEVSRQTSVMALRNANLSAQLAESSRQVDALQGELRSVKVQALTDSLTGLANRRMFDETLRRRLSEASAECSELCLIICDIDHFKRINDGWGHSVGDQFIRFVARSLEHHARPDWLVARYGGEEFAVIMPKTDVRAAHDAARAISAEIRSKSFTRRSTGEAIGAITVSIGIALRRHAEAGEDLVERADAHLYDAKRLGRNRVCGDGVEPHADVRRDDARG